MKSRYVSVFAFFVVLALIFVGGSTAYSSSPHSGKRFNTATPDKHEFTTYMGPKAQATNIPFLEFPPIDEIPELEYSTPVGEPTDVPVPEELTPTKRSTTVRRTPTKSIAVTEEATPEATEEVTEEATQEVTEEVTDEATPTKRATSRPRVTPTRVPSGNSVITLTLENAGAGTKIDIPSFVAEKDVTSITNGQCPGFAPDKAVVQITAGSDVKTIGVQYQPGSRFLTITLAATEDGRFICSQASQNQITETHSFVVFPNVSPNSVYSVFVLVDSPGEIEEGTMVFLVK